VSIPKLVGQSLMGSFTGVTPSSSFLARIQRGELGGVILFGDNIATTARLKAIIATLQAAAARGGNPPLLIATDQEGGTVKRLPAGPPPAAAETMGAQDSPQTVARIGDATGLYLRQLGINVDLAPVLDVGNAATSFLGSRIFSSNPVTVASLGSSFATGLQNARVAATAKHFPGLGTAPGNTDTHAVLVTSSRQDLDRRLAPFRAAIRAGVKLVMVSNASYKALDPSGPPASLSPQIVGKLLRGQLGFSGVVITDAMSAPGPAAYPDAPTRALNAGVDILLYSDSRALSAQAFSLLINAVRTGEVPLATLEASNGRIQALKRWLEQ
jgi:beta-N-acetylhexosaminidase